MANKKKVLRWRKLSARMEEKVEVPVVEEKKLDTVTEPVVKERPVAEEEPKKPIKKKVTKKVKKDEK